MGGRGENAQQESKVISRHVVAGKVIMRKRWETSVRIARAVLLWLVAGRDKELPLKGGSLRV